MKTTREDHETSNAQLELAVDRLERERATMQRALDDERARYERERQSSQRLQRRVDELLKLLSTPSTPGGNSLK
jgi:hypothetical protein